MTPPRPDHRSLRIVHMGTVAYDMALAEQHRAWQEVVASQKNQTPHAGYLLFNQHPAVITFGRRHVAQSLRAEESQIRAAGIELFHTQRGGETTLHSPGQLVLYPILPLRYWRLSVRCFVDLLEKCMARTCLEIGIAAHPGNAQQLPVGCWVGDKKIGSVGVRVHRGVTQHGLALNVCNDLSYFRWITACGMPQLRLTSICIEAEAKQLHSPSISQVALILEKQFKLALQQAPSRSCAAC